MMAPAPTPQLRPIRARTTRACTAGPAVPTAPSAAAAVPRASPGRTARSVSVSPVPCPCCWWGWRGQGGAGGLGVPKAPRCPCRHRRLPVEPLPERRHLHRRGQLLRLPLPAQLRGQPLRERWGMSGTGQPPRPTPVGSIAGQIQTIQTPAPMGTQEPLPLQWGAPPCTPGCWGLSPVPGVPMSPQTRRAATTTGTSSRATATATSPAGAPGRTRSGTAAAAPGTSPASTRRRSTASSTVRGFGGRTGDRGTPQGRG